MLHNNGKFNNKLQNKIRKIITCNKTIKVSFKINLSKINFSSHGNTSNPLSTNNLYPHHLLNSITKILHKLAILMKIIKLFNHPNKS